MESQSVLRPDHAARPPIGARGSLSRILRPIPYWANYKHAALPHGLLACWSSPIFSSSREVLGTFAMYYREARGPLDAEVALVNAATHLAAIAISRDRAEQTLRRSEVRANHLAQLYAVASSINEAIVRIRTPLE